MRQSLAVGLFVLIFLVGVGAAVFAYRGGIPVTPLEYSAATIATSSVPKAPIVVHLATPEPLKGVYLSECGAASKTLRQQVVSLVKETELNAIVIDVKDYSGRIPFVSNDPLLVGTLSRDCPVSDLQDFIQSLHEEGIYTIARITAFQDPLLSAQRPDLAVHSVSHPEKLWRDRKGLSYIDPGARAAWVYLVALAREAYRIGFDEINFDYVRFPSDGDMADVLYPFSESIVDADPNHGKILVLSEFFAYLARELKKDNIVISADLFGMTTTNQDDLNIGQKLEVALEHFDYVAPMVYPSHYPPTFIGLANPAAHPYEVVKYSMDQGVSRASTTPLQLRPWLQDFNLGATYTSDMVRAQIQATYDSGLTSWMLWNAANRYTRDALLPQ